MARPGRDDGRRRGLGNPPPFERRPPMSTSNASSLSPGQLAQIACLLEVSARKPGNVYPGRGFVDANFVDFLLSASVIAAPLDRARHIGVGAAVLEAV